MGFLGFHVSYGFSVGFPLPFKTNTLLKEVLMWRWRWLLCFQLVFRAFKVLNPEKSSQE